jgi:hypothetical protein
MENFLVKKIILIILENGKRVKKMDMVNRNMKTVKIDFDNRKNNKKKYLYLSI